MTMEVDREYPYWTTAQFATNYDHIFNSFVSTYFLITEEDEYIYVKAIRILFNWWGYINKCIESLLDNHDSEDVYYGDVYVSYREGPYKNKQVRVKKVEFVETKMERGHLPTIVFEVTGDNDFKEKYAVDSNTLELYTTHRGNKVDMSLWTAIEEVQWTLDPDTDFNLRKTVLPMPEVSFLEIFKSAHVAHKIDDDNDTSDQNTIITPEPTVENTTIVVYDTDDDDVKHRNNYRATTDEEFDAWMAANDPDLM